jgi:putative two-component system response regulator
LNPSLNNQGSANPGLTNPGLTNGSVPNGGVTGLVAPKLATASILLIDADRKASQQLERWLTEAGAASIRCVYSAAEAIEAFGQSKPDVILVDIGLPPNGAFDLLSHLKGLLPKGEAQIPVIMLTTDGHLNAKKRAIEAGVQDFLHKEHERAELILRLRNVIQIQHLYRQVNRQKMWLEETVRVRTRQLEAARREVIERLALAAEYRDDDTGEHTRRVGRMSAHISQALDEDPIFVESIGVAAPLHDVGKIGIPDSLLLKAGPLSADERVSMQQHTVIGGAILNDCVEPVMLMARLIAMTHHERWDGRGYPNGLQAQDIPLAGRIVAVADAFDAMVSERPYKKPIRRTAAIEEIVNCSGKQFDPKVVQAFLKVQDGQVALPDFSKTLALDAQLCLDLANETA